jgi:Spy/CpxP family protein refolding chaperone
MRLRLLQFLSGTDKQVAGVFVRPRRRRSTMRSLTAATLVVVAAFVCPALWAADEAKDNRVGEGLAERIQDLNLTDEQEAKIADIAKESAPKVQEAGKELATIVKEEEDKVRDVLTAEQKEKLQTLKEERKERRLEGLAQRMARLQDLDLTEAELAKIEEIRKEYRPKIVKAMEAYTGILTDEQKKAREEGLKAGKKRKEIVAALNLTDDQKEKVTAACKDLAAIVREEMEKIRDVLTEEQQAKLPELKDERKERVRDKWACRVANLKDLNLTDEQKTKLEEIRKEYRPKVHEAGNKLRAAVREEVEMIVAVIKA